MKVILLNMSDLARHFRVSYQTVRLWVKHSGDPDWGYTPTPDPAYVRNGRKFWTPEQLLEWDEWYRRYTNEKRGVLSRVLYSA